MYLPDRGQIQKLTIGQKRKQIKIIIIKMLKIGFPYSYDFESVL